KPRVEYTIPAFQSGLDGAESQLLAPRGARLPRDFERSLKVRVSSGTVKGGERFVFRRVHLPRTVSFTAALELPGGAGAMSVAEGRSFGSLPETQIAESPLPTP